MTWCWKKDIAYQTVFTTASSNVFSCIKFFSLKVKIIQIKWISSEFAVVWSGRLRGSLFFFLYLFILYACRYVWMHTPRCTYRGQGAAWFSPSTRGVLGIELGLWALVVLSFTLAISLAQPLDSSWMSIFNNSRQSSVSLCSSSSWDLKVLGKCGS